MLKESPKSIEETLGREGACGCLQVAGVGFNGLIFPQIDLRKTVERKQEKVKLGCGRNRKTEEKGELTTK